MKQNPYEIMAIDPDGILAEFDIMPGDRLLKLNGRPVLDELDIRYADSEEEILVEIEKTDGEILELEIEKDSDETLGICCDGQTLGIRRCKNHCVFCFIDQMPKGMRDTLYVKDDDERLSFLQGNYITLTNLTDELKQRIVDYRIKPINISIHTTDPELRCKMLGNRFAGSIMKDLRFFADHGIQMNGQIVVCPGYNDGDHLKRTLNDLTAFYPQLSSVSVVPVGLTKFREDLAPIEPVTSESAEEMLQIIECVQNRMLTEQGTHFVFPGDELILAAKRSLPDADYYEAFEQIENGVGMLADFYAGVMDVLAEIDSEKLKVMPFKIGIFTGTLAADFMSDCTAEIHRKLPQLDFEIIPIINHFFGEQITVSGLVTGGDILAQTEEKLHHDLVLIPENMVRYHTDVFLDDLTLSDLETTLNVPVVLSPVDGRAFVETVLRMPETF